MELKLGSGIQAVGFFRLDLDDRRVADAARRRGVIVSPLALQYRHGVARHGLSLVSPQRPQNG